MVGTIARNTARRAFSDERVRTVMGRLYKYEVYLFHDGMW